MRLSSLIILVFFSSYLFGQLIGSKDGKLPSFEKYTVSSNSIKLKQNRLDKGTLLKLDSIVRPDYSYKYFYDNYGNHIKSMVDNFIYEEFIYNNANILISYINSYYGKYDYVYDSQGHILSIVNSSWDQVNLNWHLCIKDEWVYDTNGNIIEEAKYNYDSQLNQFLKNSKIVKSYNSIGQMVEKIEYDYNFINNTLTPSDKYVYNYSANGFITQIYQLQLNSTQLWDTINKTILTYSGNLLQEEQWLHCASNQWNISGKSTYTYNSMDSLLEKVFSYYSYNGIYYPQTKYINSYDAIGYKTLESTFEMNTNSWIEKYRNEYHNDLNGNIDKIVNYSIWLQERETLFLDVSVGVNDLIVPNDYIWNHKVDSSVYHVYMDTTAIYYYSQFLPIGIEKPIYSSFQYYPNPVTNSLTIKSSINIYGSLYMIFNILGIKIEEGILNSEFENTINVEKLSHGTYILEILSKENQKETIKFVK